MWELLFGISQKLTKFAEHSSFKLVLNELMANTQTF